MTDQKDIYTRIGDFVEFNGEDGYFRGHVVALFNKRDSNKLRCVVEDDRGLLLIKNPARAMKIEQKEKQNDPTK